LLFEVHDLINARTETDATIVGFRGQVLSQVTGISPDVKNASF
jgi:hypothetical protein